MNAARRESLAKEYQEVSKAFGLLTDIRFKLLGALPLASAAAAVLAADKGLATTFALSLFALVVTLGLATYNARNDQLYDALVGRAAQIERSLGLPDGAFANRPRPWLAFHLLGREWKVDHGNGVALVYAATAALWLSGLIAPILELLRTLHLAGPPFDVSSPSSWVHAAALLLAVAITATTFAGLRRQRKDRMARMRGLAAHAVGCAHGMQLGSPPCCDHVVRLCAELCGEPESAVAARAAFLAGLDRRSAEYYLGPNEPAHRAAALVAQLTQLPPGWLLDCWTKRKG